MRLSGKIVLATVLIGAAVSASTLVAQASQQDTSDNPPPAVEDYAYPGGDAIFADYGVKLISGDGHILFAPCSTPPTGDVGVMKVRTGADIGIDHAGVICFKVTAPTGHLDLKVPAVFEINGDGRVDGAGHKATAELTTDDGVHTSVVVKPKGSTSVGVGAKPGSPPTTLLQLDVKP